MATLVAVTYDQIGDAITAQNVLSEMYRTDKQYVSCVFLSYSENIILKKGYQKVQLW